MLGAKQPRAAGIVNMFSTIVFFDNGDVVGLGIDYYS